MRHRVSGRHLGRDTAHRRSLYRNLVTDLLHYERITTTEAKAKEIRGMAERIITLGRKGDLHSRRQASRFVLDKNVVKKVFDEIGPRMKDRPGGYLRITSLEPRKGDGAKMAAIELVDFVEAGPTERPERVTAPASAAPAGATVAGAGEPTAAAPQEPAAEAEEAPEDSVEAPAVEETAEEEAPEATATAEAPEEEQQEAETPAEAAAEEELAPEAEAESPADVDAEAEEDDEGEKQS
jgi:large subunit ribosomal protein L17